MTDAVQILTPMGGRFVMGDLYSPKTKDADGKPLVGKDKVTPRVEYVCGVAIPKGTEQHWAHTEWGQKVWAAGAAGHGNLITRPDFSWKIIDGDSQIPNKKGKKPCDREGYPGHWVLVFSGGFAPKICTKDGSQPILEAGVVKPGHYIQVFGTVKDNAPSQTPGVYLNLMAVAHSGFGKEIQQASVDTGSVGFGQGQMPAGASAVPVGGGMVPPAIPVAPAIPAAPVAVTPNHAALGMPAPAAPPVVPVVPAIPAAPAVPVAAPVGIPQVPVAAAPLAPPPPPPAAPVVAARQMTALANGATYEQFRAGGWTDEQLIANGMMTP